MCGVQEKAIKTSVYSLYITLFVWELKNISFLSGTEVARHRKQRFKVSKHSAESFESACRTLKPLDFSTSGGCSAGLLGRAGG